MPTPVIFHHFGGAVPDRAGLYVASGLGSSGLTTGPIIGWHLAQLVVGGKVRLDYSGLSS